MKVEKFINEKKDKYTTVPQTYNSSGNDYILDSYSNVSWKKSITLKAKSFFKNEYKQTVYTRFFLGFYLFENLGECEKAKAALLKCIGVDCYKVQWGDNGSPVHSPPFIYIFNSTQIIVCHIYCEHVNEDWTLFKKELVTWFGSKQSRIMELSGCGGSLKFIN